MSVTTGSAGALRVGGQLAMLVEGVRGRGWCGVRQRVMDAKVRPVAVK